MSLAAFRAKLPVLNKGYFLNYAATCPLSVDSVAKVQAAAATMTKPLGSYFYDALSVVEQTRRELAELIGAHPSEIAFAQNTSSAVSTIALAAPLRAGDRVLVPDNEFPSNFYPWQNLQSKGINFSSFSLKKNEPITQTLEKLDLTGVKLISVSAVSFETGRLLELAEFAKFCRERGIFSCVDAIQAVGVVPLDVHALGIDFLAGGAQKWLLGSVGCGYIYARAGLLEQLFVPMVGWTSSQYPEYFELKHWEFAKEMTRFEPGLPNYLAIVGLHQSLQELKSFGWSEIYRRISANQEYLSRGIAGLGIESLTGAKDSTAGILSFLSPPDSDHRILGEYFHNKEITVTCRENYIRVSPHFFQEKRELDHFLNATAALYKKERVPQLSIPQKKFTKEKDALGYVLITGAIGNLGKIFAAKFHKLGHPLFLVDSDPQLQTFAQSLGAKYSIVDFSDTVSTETFLDTLGAQMPSHFSALIHCVGLEDGNIFRDLSRKQVRNSFEVNLLAPAQLLHTFIKVLVNKDPLGVLQIVSSSGRCSYPLLSTYGAANGALWALSEALGREEHSQLNITTYVAPAMHSPMQKRMGRIALRYFRIGGTAFQYALPEVVAAEALDAFFAQKALFVSKANRLKLLVNALFPKLMNRKVRDVFISRGGQ